MLQGGWTGMKFEGSIVEIDLLDRLLELSSIQFTGAIRFENDAIIKIIYFKSGDVLSASTNDRSDSIDEILLKSNKVSREHIRQALARRKETETLGDALLGLGFITKKELAWARRVQLIGIIRSLVHWTEGSYTIVNDYLPKREEGTIFYLPQILVEMIVTDDDRSRVESAFQGGTAVPKLTSDAGDRYARLGLNEDADAIFARIDGRRSVAEIAGASTMDAFSVYKLLYAFQVLGLISTGREEPKETLEVSAPATGLAQPTEDDWSLDDYEEPSFPSIPPVAPMQPSSLGSGDELLPSIDLDEEPAELEILSAPTLRMETPKFDTPKSDLPKDDFPREEFFPPAAPPPRKTAEMTKPAAAPRARTTVSAPSFASAAPRRKKSGGRGRWLLLILLLLAAAGGGAWYWLVRPAPLETPTQVAASPERPVPAPVTPTGTIVETTTDTSAMTTSALGTAAAAPPDTVLTTAPAPMPAPPLAATPVTTTAPPATPTKTVATTPGVVAGRDPKRSEFDSRAREYAAESATAPFAIQLAFVCEVSSLESALKRGGANVWFVPGALGGRSCYRVLWGRYPDRAAAGRGLSDVPAFFRSGRPVVVNLRETLR